MALQWETKQRYKNNAVQFDMHVRSIIDRCFNNDEYLAFDNVVPFKLAKQTKCRLFLASDCVQKYLHRKRFGHINYKRKAIHLRVVLCSLFLPLFPQDSSARISWRAT